MRYQKFPVSAEASTFVECYFIWDGHTAEKTEVQSPPNCFGGIVINYGDPTLARQNTPDWSPVPDAFVCGLFTSNYRRVLNGNIGMAGIVFKPTALHNLFGLRMSQLVNTRIPLSMVLGETADHLYSGITQANTDSERITVLERFVSVHLSEAKTKLSIIDEAADWIDQHMGTITVNEVAAHFKISRRYLEKQFLENRRIPQVICADQAICDCVDESGIRKKSRLAGCCA